MAGMQVLLQSRGVGHDHVVDDYYWPDRAGFEPERIREAWSAITHALPVGSFITGKVIALMPFGAFVQIDGLPAAVGLAEITSLADGAVLPAIGQIVNAEVVWHTEHNHQVKLRLVAAPDGSDAAETAQR